MSPQSFDDFYSASRRAVLAQVYGLTGDWQEAQDIVQDAYAQAWSRWDVVATYEDPTAWVRTVAWRLTISRWRRARTRVRLRIVANPPRDYGPEPSPDSIVIMAALSRLPKAARTAIVLHYVGDVSVAEIARLMRLPIGTVKSHLSRGRQRLADELRSEWGEVAAPVTRSEDSRHG